ncbi:FAD-binding oxidoreductase [Streptomonospora nanhaiensis]|uniref:FAD/FMN-containing dehydrogenase n=1 Tax=Streptomonospora nanhaiensis TaxID=1323731 RepID=A0A853BHP0_9ACTN|nr:FAD-dependent oxidoreductase [Streptomonospora nanhaiensis]MBX9389968.1 FAD-dependent oxidoreductase [Streptomonospora nanhaiensis]NYI94244.1 FAD/FMN-containing dehydrogenase [Streptomonospora nanhaiensis]
MSETIIDSAAVARALKGRTTGPVHLPGTDAYTAACTGYQLRAPHRPAAVVAAQSAEDVRAAVAAAADLGVPVAVQATGHGRGAPLEGGVLISTAAMDGVRVDPAAGTAWVEAGAPWRRVIEAAAPHGLAPLSGSMPGVGAVAYTLGGGVGLLSRRYGFAADHVRRLEVVTPDGRPRTASAQSEPELFWALRGGGGGFGVVTGMEIDLFPVERIYGGALFFDTARAPGVVDAWRRWTRTVPEELTSAVTMLPYPDIPQLPEPLRGRHVAKVQIAYTGPAQEGRRLVEPLRAVGEPLLDTLRELPYAESGAVFDEPDRPHGYLSRALLLEDVDPAAAADLTKRSGPAAPLMCVVGLRHLGGALDRPPRVPNAVRRGGAAYCVSVLSPVEPGQEDTARSLHADLLAPFAAQRAGTLLNFSFGPSDAATVRAAFDPADLARLAALRARLDPAGLLRPNHPVGPAHAAG